MSTRKAMGRCWNCNLGFVWKRRSRQRLADVECPVCNGRLAKTTGVFKGPWYALDHEVAGGIHGYIDSAKDKVATFITAEVWDELWMRYLQRISAGKSK